MFVYVATNNANVSGSSERLSEGGDVAELVLYNGKVWPVAMTPVMEGPARKISDKLSSV